MKRTLAVLCIAAMGAVVTGSALASASTRAGSGGTPGRAANSYKLHRLVADQAGHAKSTDPNLVNAWGLAAGPTTPWWVNAADNDVSTLYDGKGAVLPLVVDVAGGPTGLVFNGSTELRREQRHRLRAVAVPVRDRRRHDQRLEPERAAAQPVDPFVRGRRRVRPGSELQGPRDRIDGRRRHALRGRLPQRQGRHVRRHLQPGEHGVHVRRPEHPRRLRAVRDPGDRRHDLRDVRQAGRRCG